MEAPDKIIRLIIPCNTKGIAEQPILDSDNFFSATKFPIGLPSLAAPDSVDALANLWAQVIDKSMENNILMTLQSGNRREQFTFSGYLLKDKVLLCGSNEAVQSQKALSGILQINSEQQNLIRRAEKVLINLHGAEKREMNEVSLNDFSQLNNELINKQRMLVQKNAKILQLNEKLEAASENMQMFAYSVSHDLKEPVRMVNSFMSLFQKKCGESLDEEAKTYVDFALDGARRLDRMITDLLEFYRAVGSASVETVDLNEVVNEVLQILQNQIGVRDAKISVSPLPTLKGSHTGWRQIFQNLVSNAIKFVPAERSPEIKISAIQEGGAWQISVSDNGTGIDPKFHKSIFNLFRRVHKSADYEGTGMGLAIVKKVVENFEGEIAVDSEPGVGTTFTISAGSIDSAATGGSPI